MLIEELRRAIDMVVRTGIRSSYDHHCQTRSAGRKRIVDTDGNFPEAWVYVSTERT
jgi:hypothetical protein